MTENINEEKIDKNQENNQEDKTLEENKENVNVLNDEKKEPEEDLFAGEYEKFEEKDFYGHADYQDTKILPTENFNSSIIPKRKDKQLFKILITRKKKYFEEPIDNLFSIKSANDEQTAGQNEVKGSKSANEYPLIERPYIEMGFQTPNSFTTKSFQVAKTVMKNDYTQIENKFLDIKPEIEKIQARIFSKKMTDIESFLTKAFINVEQALQSNETINIFMNDFDLDKFTRIQTEEKKSNIGAQLQKEIRTFRDSSAGNKKNKEKKVINIRSISETDPFIAMTMIRNFTFDIYKEKFGIPFESKIIFWNIGDLEQNSPIFEIPTRSEVTYFEFDPYNCNNMACALNSGQIMFVKFFNLLGTLRKYAKSDFSQIRQNFNIKDHYIYIITGSKNSHSGKVTGLRWLTKGYTFKKKQIINAGDFEESGLVASSGEDGQIIIWDYRNIEMTGDKSKIYDVDPYINKEQIEINKVDSIGKISGTGLEFELLSEKFFFFVPTIEGRTYYVDMSIKNTQDNLAANVVKYYYNRFFRPVLYFEKSPFFDNIFLTVHDFHFCLWCKERNKPILISPNLKKSSYTCGKFSPSRPGVLYLCRTNGKIDIWDFLDESHKPSVKDSYIKEIITSIHIFKYKPPIEENEEQKQNDSTEFMICGDMSGQISVIEVPKLFSEKNEDEDKIMKDFFENAIHRQNYMDERYKTVEENISNNRNTADIKGKTNEESNYELKYEEEDYNNIRNSILEELGIEIPVEEKKEDEKE